MHENDDYRSPSRSCSISRSPSRDKSPSLSPSRDRSPSAEHHHTDYVNDHKFYIDDYKNPTDDDHKMPAVNVAKISGKKTSHKKNIKKKSKTSKASTKVDVHRTARSRNDHNDSDDPHLDEERKHPAPRKNFKGKRIGFGLQFECPHYDLSREEMMTGQGHPDCVQTCDMFHDNQITLCFEESDDSQHRSD